MSFTFETLHLEMSPLKALFVKVAIILVTWPTFHAAMSPLNAELANIPNMDVTLDVSPLGNVPVENTFRKHRAHIRHIECIPARDITIEGTTEKQFSHIVDTRNVDMIQITLRTIQDDMILNEAF